MELKMEEIIKEVRKIQAIADLLICHSEEEYGVIGQIISDISFPLLKKLESYTSTQLCLSLTSPSSLSSAKTNTCRLMRLSCKTSRSSQTNSNIHSPHTLIKALPWGTRLHRAGQEVKTPPPAGHTTLFLLSANPRTF